jgi:hypothetical protein
MKGHRRWSPFAARAFSILFRRFRPPQHATSGSWMSSRGCGRGRLVCCRWRAIRAVRQRPSLLWAARGRRSRPLMRVISRARLPRGCGWRWGPSRLLRVRRCRRAIMGVRVGPGVRARGCRLAIMGVRQRQPISGRLPPPPCCRSTSAPPCLRGLGALCGCRHRLTATSWRPEPPWPSSA